MVLLYLKLTLIKKLTVCPHLNNPNPSHFLFLSVKKSALTLLRKIVRYTTLNIVQALCEEGAPYSAQIVETIAYVLEVILLETCFVFVNV